MKVFHSVSMPAVLAFLLATCAVARHASIKSENGTVVLQMEEGKDAVVRIVDAGGRTVGEDIPLATIEHLNLMMVDVNQQMMDLSDRLDNVTNDVEQVKYSMATEDQLDDISSAVDELVLDVAKKAQQDDLNVLDTAVKGVLADIVDLEASLDSTVKHCPELKPPQNMILQVDPEFNIPGSRATYQCKPKFRFAGDADKLTPIRVCQADQTWSGSAPSCEPAPLPGVKATDAEPSCRLTYDRYMEYGHDAPASGAYLIKPDGVSNAFLAYCDMDTPASLTDSSARGWTLCGKYNAGKSGSKYLANGFIRSNRGANFMKDRKAFTGINNLRWVSIDCRSIIDGGKGKYQKSTHMMHAASNANNAKITKPTYNGVLFTNIMEDVRKDATKLFDISRDDKGTCVNRNNGAIATYDKDWKVPSNDLRTGECMLGDGHHFCSRNRNGQRFSNAGSGTCTSSGDDTIYWAWSGDDHGCNGRPFRVGTGCRNHGPTFQFNYLYVN
eukprot:m.228423 g.228423  ORF g.228423 m.228423 type:complete len:498 (-) comp15978_c0_seq3:101-1594(-)